MQILKLISRAQVKIQIFPRHFSSDFKFCIILWCCYTKLHCNYLAHTLIYFGQKKEPIKVPVSRLFSAGMKMCQIPRIMFAMASTFFKFGIAFQCHGISLFCNFLTHPLYTLDISTQAGCKFLNFQVVT